MSGHVITPAELDRERWATCGPTSVAALLGEPLATVRPAFPNQTEAKTWTTIRHMTAAILALGLRFSETERVSASNERPLRLARAWPQRGIVQVQFNGSWDRLPTAHPAQLQRSHWIAVAPVARGPREGSAMVFDVNVAGAGINGGWALREHWERVVAPEIARDFGRRATGQWWVRAGLEVAAL